jgi:hypothetical protein
MPDPSFRQFRDAATFRPEVWRSFARRRPLEHERASRAIGARCRGGVKTPRSLASDRVPKFFAIFSLLG